jgi:hypothetical protein
MRSRVAVAVLVGVFALVAVPLAASATPKAGSYRMGSGEGGGFFTVKGRTIASGATSLSNFKCNRLNAVIPRAIPVKADGSFAYSGTLRGQPGTIAFSGKFVSATKAAGTTTITKGTCSSTIKWTAKLAAG